VHWLTALVRAGSRAPESSGQRDVLIVSTTALMILGHSRPILEAVPSRVRSLAAAQARRIQDGGRSALVTSLAAKPPSERFSWQQPQSFYQSTGRDLEQLFQAITYIRRAQAPAVRPQVAQFLRTLCERDAELEQARSAYVEILRCHWMLWGPSVDVDSAMPGICEEPAMPGDALALWQHPLEHGPANALADMLGCPCSSTGSRLALAARDECSSVRSLTLGAMLELVKPAPAAGIMSSVGSKSWERRRCEVGVYSYVWLRELDALVVGVPLCRGSDRKLPVYVEPVGAYYRAMIPAFSALADVAAALPGDDALRAYRVETCREQRNALDLVLRVLAAQQDGRASPEDEDALRTHCLPHMRRSGDARTTDRAVEVRSGAKIRRRPLQACRIVLSTGDGAVNAVGVMATVEEAEAGSNEYHAPRWQWDPIDESGARGK
jgi:hypothetical protein